MLMFLKPLFFNIRIYFLLIIIFNLIEIIFEKCVLNQLELLRIKDTLAPLLVYKVALNSSLLSMGRNL